MKIYDILGVQEEQIFYYKGKAYKFIEGQRYILSSNGKWDKEFNERNLIDVIEHSDEIVKCLTEVDSTLLNSKIIEGYYYAKRCGNTIQFKKYRDYEVCTIYTCAWNNILPNNDGWVYLPDLIKKYKKKDI